MLPVRWWNRYERIGAPVPIDYADKPAFRRWCATTPAPPGGGRINLLGLRPLVAAEIKWGLFVHTRRARPQRWQLGWLRSLVTTCRDLELDSLVGLQPDISSCPQMAGAIAKEIQRELRGGTHSVGNLAPACLSCTSGKRHRTALEWRLFLEGAEAQTAERHERVAQRSVLHWYWSRCPTLR